MRDRAPAFQRSLFPARSLVPERFRGPVAPSAADANPLSPAPGGWDGGTLAESRQSFKEGLFRDKGQNKNQFGGGLIWAMVTP
jgi:hypothetical protein